LAVGEVAEKKERIGDGQIGAVASVLQRESLFEPLPGAGELPQGRELVGPDDQGQGVAGGVGGVAQDLCGLFEGSIRGLGLAGVGGDEGIAQPVRGGQARRDLFSPCLGVPAEARARR